MSVVILHDIQPLMLLLLLWLYYCYCYHYCYCYYMFLVGFGFQVQGVRSRVDLRSEAWPLIVAIFRGSRVPSGRT